MVTFVNSTLSGAGTQIDLNADPDALVGPNGFVFSTSTFGIAAASILTADVGVTILGTVSGSQNPLYVSNGDTFDVNIFIGKDGFVGTPDDSFTAIFGTGGNLRFVNYGTVDGGFDGIRWSAPQSAYFENHGSITSFGPSGDAIDMDLSEHSYNHGTMSGVGGIEIDLVGAGTLRFTNTGTITGTGGTAVDMDAIDPNYLNNTGRLNGGVFLGSGADVFVNSGVVTGDVSMSSGDDLYNGFGGGKVLGTIDAGNGDDTIRVDDNQAIIDGGANTDVVYARSDVLDVVNVELIQLYGAGDFQVLASDGAETINGNGGNNLLQGEGGNDTISGGAGDDEIQGGAGEDQIIGSVGNDIINAGADNDTVSGGAGSDTILGAAGEDQLNGGASSDSLDGGDNNDTLSGFSGDDTLLGGGGSDLLVGHDGNDSLDGGIASDVLDGGSGNDTLQGGDGSDVLRGRTGNDKLDGGTGLDFLTGGPGADSFIFDEITDAGTGATRDQIIDFEQDVDIIDLASLIDGPLAFVGTGPFTGANQVRLIETGSGSTIVQINLDANLATVEGEIRVADVVGLTADDFAL